MKVRREERVSKLVEGVRVCEWEGDFESEREKKLVSKESEKNEVNRKCDRIKDKDRKEKEKWNRVWVEKVKEIKYVKSKKKIEKYCDRDGCKLCKWGRRDKVWKMKIWGENWR